MQQNAPLLLGMSALNQLGKIEIENGKLIINSFFKNEVDVEDIEEETKNTIDWINNKLISHQYESNDELQVRQIQSFNEVREINGTYYLTGKRIQETTNFLAASNEIFLIPLLKVNNLAFEEKQYNYWLTIKIKNAEQAIAISSDSENWYKKDKIDFIISKSIDNEDLKPLLLSAFEHLIKLYSNKQATSPKIVKYEVEDGYVEHIGEMLEDGYVKKSYDKQNRLEAKQEYYIDENDKIKGIKVKTTFYNPNTGTIKHINITPSIMFDDEFIGEYKIYYDNGKLKVTGEFYDFFKNGYEVYFGNIRIGTWKWYLENGESDGEETYEVNIEYWENGTLKRIFGSYLDPNDNSLIKHGAYYEFNKNESVPSVMKKFKYGELISQK